MIKVAPSVLSADFSRLGEEIEDITRAGADYIHFDVMDGEFVPNISMGFPVLSSLRKVTGLLLDVHLMIVRPLRYIKRFSDSGADLITIHVEADTEENIHKAIREVKNCGKKAGISLKPGTQPSALEPFLTEVDLVLVMTVEPGFGGQRFMADMMPKVRTLRDRLDQVNPDCELEVDGGVDGNTAGICKEYGANVLVAGSAVFGKADRTEAIAAIRGT